MSRSINVRHSMASGGIFTRAPDNAKAGHVGDFVVMRIMDIPDDVSDAAAIKLANGTTFWPPRFIVRYTELGEGKVIKGKQVSTEVAGRLYGGVVSDARMRQLIKTGHVPAQKVGRGRNTYDWRVHVDDLALVEPVSPGRPPMTTVCAHCNEPCAGRTWRGRNIHLHKGKKICGWCAKQLKTTPV